MEIITSRKNPLIAAFRRLAGEREARREAGLLLGQGHKLLEEALAAGLCPRTVLYAGKAPSLPAGAQCVPVTEELLAYVSPMKSAPELLFTLPIPPEPGPLRGRVLALEAMQDPGNVGTVIRTAAAFGFDGVLLLGPCADPWGPKAVRASMGGAFRLPVWERPDTAGALGEIKNAGLPLYAAALREDTLAAGRTGYPPALVLAIGNEGHGLSAPVLEAADKVLRIPMAPGAESLNAAAAAAVLMWEVYRERLEHV
ncbi:MAG: RNA methyltransferase [Oscillospiraceae bacterium]|nr:RNA methyltransferase [Oscillospiraceae bacterium]